MTAPAAIDFASAFRHHFVARSTDIDRLGHVNNTVYVRWVQDMAVAHWSARASRDLQTRFVWVALRHEIDYREPVLEDEHVEGRTWLGEVSGPRFDRFVDLRKPGAQRFSAYARTVWCLLDAQTRRPVRVGPEILAPFGL